MPRKERTNAKTWERDRRNRMNTYFKTLSDLLPPHQEGRKRNKVDILIYAAKYIKDLTNRTEELFFTHAVAAHKEELNRLKKLVAQLYSRNQLLSTLLKEAGITVPAEPALEKISPLKWSNKLNVDDVDKYLDRYNECKKPVTRRSKPIGVRVPLKKKLPTTSPKKSPTDNVDTSENVDTLSEDQENHVNASITDATVLPTPETPSKSPETRNSVPQSTSIIETLSSESVGPKSGVAIRKLESRKKTKRKKSAAEEKEKQSTDVAHQGNQQLGNIIPGTLILSGGKIMPLMTPITPIPSNILVNAQAQSSNQIILGNNQANSMIVMQSIGTRIQHSVVPVRNQNIVKAVQKVTLNTVPSIGTNVGISSQDWVSNVRTIVEATKIGGRKGILPKGKEITKTTMTYKVPIPAIHRDGNVSKNSDNNVSEKNEPKSRIKKPVKGKKIKEREKNSGSNSTKDEKKLDIDCPKNEEKSRKRKNANDPKCFPPKAIKSSLPETCVSIENLRHVIEKIGEDECSDKSQKLNSDKPESAQKSIETLSSTCGDSKEEISSFEKSQESTQPSTSEELFNKSNVGTSHDSLPTAEPAISKSCDSSVLNPSIQSASPKAPSFPQLDPSKSSSTSSLSEVDKVIAETEDKIGETKGDCDLGRLNNLLNAASTQPQVPEDTRAILDSGKIILNLDTNTTTTMKQDTNIPGNTIPPVSTSTISEGLSKDDKSKEIKSLSYSSSSTFVPINTRNESLHSDLSNDLFASLQVPSSSHNPESISPTAAFLMAFPLVSSLNGKTEVLEEDMKEDLKYHSQTPPMLLQIGTIEPTIFKPKSNENKCQETIHEKGRVPQSPDKSLDITSKPLPKIINNEPIKERLYKVVPYSEPSMAPFPSTLTISTNPPNSMVQREPQPKKNSLDNPNNSNTLLETPKLEDQTRKIQKVEASTSCSIVHTSPAILSRVMDQMPKYDSNVKYPSHPEFVPNYSNFTSVDNQMPSTTRISYSTHSSSQVPQSVYSYQLPRQTFVNRSKNISSMDNQTVTYTMSQSRPITEPNDPNDYQTRNVNPTMPVSSHSLQYNYTARPKDSYPHQHQEQQRAYVEQGQTKDSTICQGTYSMHKDSQMYQDYSNVNKTLGTLDASQLSRSYAPPSSSIKDPPQNYQNYPPIVQTKEPPRDVPANLPQNYPDQSKQPTLETFDNLQRDFDSTRKDSFVPSTSTGSKLPKLPQNNQSTETQRIETSISSAVDKIPQDHFNTNYPKGNGVLLSDPRYQVKRSEAQSYGLYTKDQKKIFDNRSNSQVKSHTQPSLLRYPHQVHQQQRQQQQTNVTTGNYGQSMTENLGKSTTTVAHNSSNYSILSWTTLSPMGLGGNNNNLGHFEGGTDHVDDNDGKAICENFNYSQLHKETVGFGNILQTDQYPAPEAIIDKSKQKMSNDNKQEYGDTTKNKNVQNIQQKQTSRTHTHNQNQSMGGDYKYSGEHKNKPKYSMDSAYTQTEFGGLDQRHQQTQQTLKTHQIPESKPEKTVYSIPYDSQITFDLADPVGQSQTKCPDIYTESNYKYGDDKDQHSHIKYQPILQGQPPGVLNDNVSYNSSKGNQQQQNMNKSKIAPVQQQMQPVRPPVNWMMTPEVKHNSNIADLILPPIGKELDFCQNNIFSQTPSYNQGTSNQFYNNYDVSVSAAHTFTNVGGLQSDRFYPEEQPFSWSPTKNPQSGADHQNMKGLDQQVVSSTLPTLVGDLALGTNIPEKQNFLFGQVPPRSNELPKTSVKEKDSNFQVMLNPQTGQHTNQGTSFLSVSQLVEHEKAEKGHHQQNHHSHHHHSQAPPQSRKPRKNHPTPRTTTKRQMDMRKQNNDHQMQQHDDQKLPSAHGFSDQYQQQSHQQPQQSQKYQQNDALWRNRNCKSNYTAEALIGVNNTNLHDGNAPDKQLHAPAIKFSTDYSQNKFPGSLGTTEMVMPPINYLTTPDDGNSYGQVMNQNFNHSSYTYSPNTNIYPSTNFIPGISNTTSSYMMPLHDNPTDYLEANSFLVPNVTNITTPKSVINTSTSSLSASTSRTSVSATAPTNAKNQHYNNTGKQQQCDKRNYTNVSKKSKRKPETTMQNLEFPIGAAPMEDYHSHHHTHPSTFLPPPPHANPLYQNNSISNANRNRGTSGSANSVAMTHHPSGTSLTNFNLSTIFPEINDKVTGYKPPNTIQPGLSQSSNHPSTSYPQRSNYTTNNSLGLAAQVSQLEAGQFATDLPVPPPPSVLHYKAT
ncbi:uncharacterized protein LOC135167549 [Diachasmimorpha longicaudata]|uniref:uncharacterized protein LOC135167549 n=1 Tax=Diachasmimorpha longicaudata TaxID=58733 RepID=UPI0030B8892B